MDRLKSRAGEMLLKELENELKAKEEKLAELELELDKLILKSDLVRMVGIGISGTREKDAYFDFFEYEELENTIEKLRKEVFEYKRNSKMSYLKRTIDELKARM